MRVEYPQEKRLLLVEDEALIALSQKKELERAGYSVETVHTGEQACKRSEEELANILDATTDGIWTWHFKTDELYFSPRYYTMLGYEPDAFPASFESWLDLIHPGDREQALAVASKYLETKPDTYENEFRLRTKQGDYRWIHTRARVVQRDARGDAIYMIGNHDDITERKQAELRMRESEDLFRTVFEQSAVGIARVSPEGRFLQVNRRFCEISGYSADELLAMGFQAITHPDDLHLDQEQMAPVLAGEQDGFELEKRYIHKQGHPIWIHLYSSVARDEQGSIKYAIASIVDISERKRERDALQEQEQRFRLIAESSGEDIWQLGLDGRATYVSPAVKPIFGYTPEESIGLHFSVFFPPSEQERAQAVFRKVVEERSYQVLEFQAQRRNGAVFTAEVSVGPVLQDGAVVAVQGIARDVSERVQMRDALLESERFKDLLLNSTGEMFAYYDLDLRIQWANRASAASVGLDVEAIQGRYCFDLWQGRNSPCPGCPVLRAKESKQTEVAEMQTPDGRWYYIRGYPVLDRDGNLVGLTEFGQDITRRKQAENALRKNEANIVALIENTNGSIWSVDREYRLIVGNSVFHSNIERQRGRPFAAGESLLPQEYPPEVLQEWQGYYDRALGGEQFSVVAQRRFLDPDRVMEYRFNPIQGADGAVSGVTVFGRDVTVREAAERALREREIALLESQQMSKTSSFRWNLADNSVAWTPQFHALVEQEPGAFPQTLEGFNTFLHPEDSEHLQQAIDAALAGRQELDVQYRLRLKGGKIKYVVSRGRVIRDEQSGEPRFVVGYNQDITAFKRQEQEALRQLQEKETILREVHHRIKNNLAAVESLVSLQARSAGSEAAAALHEIQTRIASMRVLYERLLFSDDYSELDTARYFNELLDALLDLFPDTGRIELKKNINDFKLTTNLLFPLGLIVNELCTNALKYAFSKDTPGLLRVSLHKRGKRVTLVVADNGPGLPAAVDPHTGGGFGLLLVRILSQQIGGELAIKSRKGTEVRLEFTVA